MIDSNQDEIFQVVDRISKILTDLKLKYHLTGGLVSSFYGEPRFTQDIDIVLKISASDRKLLRDFLSI